MCVVRNLVYGETLWQIIIGSNKHKSSKEKFALKEAQERDIAKCLKVHDNMSHPVGEILSMEQRVYRLKVLNFLRAAVPLSKLDAFRDILKENVSFDRQMSHE